MEYCQLGDLSYLIKRRDRLAAGVHTRDMVEKYPNPPAGGLHEVVVRHFLQQLASALEFLRNKNLIHRDVKPQNLLLNPSPLYYTKNKPEIMPFAPTENSLIPVAGIESLPMLKIADFGFARSLPSTSLAETLCGSPLYMAPEILRYEKYDAKADLWSVGTVLYEMIVGKPYFRASNHVELLRKIERGEDRIKFPEDAVLSDSMKRLIRGLLKRNPVERMSYFDFFNHTIIKDEIPGLVGEDQPRKTSKPATSTRPSSSEGSTSRDGRAVDTSIRPGPQTRNETFNSSKIPSSREGPSVLTRTESAAPRPFSEVPARAGSLQRRATGYVDDTDEVFHDARERTSQARRPSMTSHATAPARQELHGGGTRNTAATLMQRQSSRNSSSSSPLVPKEGGSERERISQRNEDRAVQEAREAQEQAANDVAFERDYVVVEKRAVEVNAFADELAASPRIHGTSVNQKALQHGAMVRRETAPGGPPSISGNQTSPSRGGQLVSTKRPEVAHHRTTSYGRHRSGSSTSSAIAKALNLASDRLWSFGLSPPLGTGRGGPSPPLYTALPAYPTNQGSMILIGDVTKGQGILTEDSKAVNLIEESATRSDVVYGFAEVKFKQLMPLAPSTDHGLGLRQAGIPEKNENSVSASEDGGLTIDAIVTLSEEALVLYVKALSLLAKSMDIAGSWWARKSRGEVIEESTSPRTQPNPAQNAAVGNRVNNVVQWVRSRFNEVLEKADFVRLKLIEAQKRLPTDHPSHPNNHPSSSYSGGLGTSADNVVVSAGVTAEKLIFYRALEMSRAAAVNELVVEDLPGCEIAYVTAIRMLEAVLEDDGDPVAKMVVVADKEQRVLPVEGETFSLVNPDDRESVLKRKSFRKYTFCDALF